MSSQRKTFDSRILDLSNKKDIHKILNPMFKKHLGCSFEEIISVFLDPGSILNMENPSYALMCRAITLKPELVYELKNVDLKLWALAIFFRHDIKPPKNKEEKALKLSRKIFTHDWAQNLVNKFNENSQFIHWAASSNISVQDKKELTAKFSFFIVAKKLMSKDLFLKDTLDAGLDFSLCCHLLEYQYDGAIFSKICPEEDLRALTDDQLLNILLKEYHKNELKLKIGNL